jgi:hypothetical protein
MRGLGKIVFGQVQRFTGIRAPGTWRGRKVLNDTSHQLPRPDRRSPTRRIHDTARGHAGAHGNRAVAQEHRRSMLRSLMPRPSKTRMGRQRRADAGRKLIPADQRG